MSVTKAVIPAAGLGTRMLSATKAVPKELLPIVDRPTLDYLIDELLQAGIRDILIITGRGKGAIEDYFDYAPELESALLKSGKELLHQQMRHIAERARISFVRQGEPKGLGHAVLCAREFVGDAPFALLLGDDVMHAPQKSVTAQLCEAYDRCGASVLGVQEVQAEAVSRYGIIDPGAADLDLYPVRSMVEKPSPEQAPSRLAALGRYVLTPEVFPLLAEAKPGVGGEIQLTDALSTLAERDRLRAFAFEGTRYDTGDKLGYLQAVVEFALRDKALGASFEHYLKSLFTAQ